MSNTNTADIGVRSIKIDQFVKLASDKPIYFGDEDVKIYRDTDGSLTMEADVSVKIVNPENQADGTLGGTPILIIMTIGGVPYYLRAYPTVS